MFYKFEVGLCNTSVNELTEMTGGRGGGGGREGGGGVRGAPVVVGSDN